MLVYTSLLLSSWKAHSKRTVNQCAKFMESEDMFRNKTRHKTTNYLSPNQLLWSEAKTFKMRDRCVYNSNENVLLYFNQVCRFSFMNSTSKNSLLPIKYFAACTSNCSVSGVPELRMYHTVNSHDISVTVSQMKKILRSYGVNFVDGYTCLIAACPICSLQCKNETKDRNFYINKTTGMAVCGQCSYVGKWTVLENFLAAKKKNKSISAEELNALKERSPEEFQAMELWQQLEKTSVLVSSLPEHSFNDILQKFKLPDVPLSVIAQFDARINEDKSVLYFPLYNVDGKVIGYKVLRQESKGQEETYPVMNCAGLITSRQGRSVKQDAAVLVHRLSDALALAGQKLPCQVICLPHGVTHLPQQVLPSLERYNKLILWFGNGVGSLDAARHFAKKLDEKRCFFVRPIDQQRTPLAALLARQDLRAIVLAAQPITHKAITTFSSLREDVLSELQNVDKVQGVKWKRFPALNRILKGHRRGEFTVLTGPTGSGKTTLMSEYSLDLAMQGVNTLWGSFEIRNARLARTMLQQMAEIPLETNLDQFDSWADQFEQLPLYFMTFHGQQSVKVVMEAVEHAAYVHDIAHVVVDNVQFMMGISEETRHIDRFWKQDSIIASFRTFATKKNCHVTLVIHPRKERDADDLTSNSIFGSAKAAQEADNILIIQDKRLTSVQGKKYLQVAKNRYTGDLGVMVLEFDKSSLSYAQKKKKQVDGKGSHSDHTSQKTSVKSIS